MREGKYLYTKIFLLHEESRSNIVHRFMNGAGLGVVLATVSVYIVEIATTDMRGFLGCFVQFLGSVGVLLTFVVGSYVNWWQLALIQVSCDWSPGRVLTSDWSAAAAPSSGATRSGRSCRCARRRAGAAP